MSKVLIIGAGAAGMYAAAAAAGNGHEVHVYEKNEKPGKKLFITGKGRCNLTNACEVEEEGTLEGERSTPTSPFTLKSHRMCRRSDMWSSQPSPIPSLTTVRAMETTPSP